MAANRYDAVHRQPRRKLGKSGSEGSSGGRYEHCRNGLPQSSAHPSR